MMLELKDVHTYYGNIHALTGISLTVEKGEIVTLIGANGAGKTTTLRTICGLLKPRPGQIFLEGQEITNLKAHQIVYKGVAMVPEGLFIFSRLMGTETGDLRALSLKDRSNVSADLERVFSVFPRL